MDKVYILQGAKGSWDNYGTFIIGVYSTLNEANIQKEEYRKEVLIQKNKYSKEEAALLQDKLDELSLTDSLEFEDYPDAIKEYYHWSYGKSYIEYNEESFITEHVLNETRDYFS